MNFAYSVNLSPSKEKPQYPFRFFISVVSKIIEKVEYPGVNINNNLLAYSAKNLESRSYYCKETTCITVKVFCLNLYNIIIPTLTVDEKLFRNKYFSSYFDHLHIQKTI